MYLILYFQSYIFHHRRSQTPYRDQLDIQLPAGDKEQEFVRDPGALQEEKEARKREYRGIDIVHYVLYFVFYIFVNLVIILFIYSLVCFFF